MIIEYDDTGRITHAISDPVAKEVREHYLANGAMEAPRGTTIEKQYVKDGAVVERPVPTINISVSGRTITVTGAPDGSAIKVEIEGVTVDADTTIEFDEPGPVTVIVAPPWPMMEVRHDLEIE